MRKEHASLWNQQIGIKRWVTRLIVDPWESIIWRLKPKHRFAVSKYKDNFHWSKYVEVEHY